MRIVSTLLTVAALGYGAYYVYETKPEIAQQAMDLVNTGSLLSLEARYTAQQIMESQRYKLIKDGNHQFGAATLQYHPHLLMEVKFTNDNMETQEGAMLWSTVDGEMVMDTRSWQKPHGFFFIRHWICQYISP